MLGLLNRTPLTLYRKSSSDGYLDDTGRWVKPTNEITIPFRCSLQPYKQGDEQNDLPNGIRATDAYTIRTKTKILTADDITNQQADETQIKGIRYECFSVEDWTHYGLKTDHYKAVFIRKDKL